MRTKSRSCDCWMTRNELTELVGPWPLPVIEAWPNSGAAANFSRLSKTVRGSWWRASEQKHRWLLKKISPSLTGTNTLVSSFFSDLTFRKTFPTVRLVKRHLWLAAGKHWLFRAVHSSSIFPCAPLKRPQTSSCSGLGLLLKDRNRRRQCCTNTRTLTEQESKTHGKQQPTKPMAANTRPNWLD